MNHRDRKNMAKSQDMWRKVVDGGMDCIECQTSS